MKKNMDRTVAWLEQHHIDLGTIAGTLALVIGGFFVIILVNRTLRLWLTRLEPRIHLPYETVLIVTRVVNGALWTITALLVLDAWGVSIGGLWTLLVGGAAVIGVGFLATWAIVSNVTASFCLTLWRPFRLGHTVEIVPENLKGRVIDVNLMFTTLRDESGAAITIPNNLFFQKMFKVSGSAEQTAFELLEARERGKRIANSQ
jgi:small-conductance mechanosensitive channel